MAKGIRVCKVCGAEYEYCHTVRRKSGIFRWQDVACCPEHGRQYLEEITASRSDATAANNKSSNNEDSLPDLDSPFKKRSYTCENEHTDS